VGAGDIIASAQGALTLDAIREHDLMDNATVRGRQFKETMRDADLPGVDDVRGKGCCSRSSSTRRSAATRSRKARSPGPAHAGVRPRRTPRVLPPLDVTEREIELGCDLLTSAIADAA